MRAAREVAEKNVRNAEQEVKREKREMQQARERAERRAGNAARNLKNAGLPRIFAGTMKRDAQESAGRADDTHAAGSARPRPGSTRPGGRCATSRRSRWNCPAPTSRPGARSSSANGMQVRRGGRLFAGDGVDLASADPSGSR